MRKLGFEVKKENQNAGFTLVELIVTFALLGVFMVAASYVITAALGVYYHVKATDYAQTVSDTLLDKVTGEIAGAQVGSSDRYTMIISADNREVSLYNRYGSPIVITAPLTESDKYADAPEVNPGELVIHYRTLYSNVGATTHEATNWVFDKNVYADYLISKLTFTQYQTDAGLGTNVIAVDMEITNQKNGFVYEQNRYVECYNFEDATDVDKIQQGVIPADADY